MRRFVLRTCAEWGAAGIFLLLVISWLLYIDFLSLFDWWLFALLACAMATYFAAKIAMSDLCIAAPEMCRHCGYPFVMNEKARACPECGEPYDAPGGVVPWRSWRPKERRIVFAGLGATTTVIMLLALFS